MIEVREAKLDDLPFIFSTWLRSYRHSSQFAKKISNDVFFQWHHKVIERFIERNGRVLIAHAAGEPEVILGYICREPSEEIVQYVYVKRAFRKMGIAKELYKVANIANNSTFTHWTLDTTWITKKLTELKYNPYLL